MTSRNVPGLAHMSIRRRIRARLRRRLNRAVKDSTRILDFINRIEDILGRHSGYKIMYHFGMNSWSERFSMISSTGAGSIPNLIEIRLKTSKKFIEALVGIRKWDRKLKFKIMRGIPKIVHGTVHRAYLGTFVQDLAISRLEKVKVSLTAPVDLSLPSESEWMKKEREAFYDRSQRFDMQ